MLLLLPSPPPLLLPQKAEAFTLAASTLESMVSVPDGL